MDSEDQNKNSPSKNFRIDCKSKSSITYVNESIENELRRIISCSESSTPSLKDTAEKLIEVYRSALGANLLLNGQAVDIENADLDTTSEYEAFDIEKEHYIKHDLLDKLDMQMVKTIGLRKTVPKQIRSKLKKLIRPQLKYLVMVNVEPDTPANVAMETNSDCVNRDTDSDPVVMETECAGNLSTEDVNDRLHGASDQTKYIKQKCEDMIQKAKDLSRAISQFKKTEKSEIQQAFYETPPSTPDCGDNKLLIDYNKPPSKKLNI